MQVVIIGNAENRRVTAFCEAAVLKGLPPVIVVPYVALLSGAPFPVIPAGSMVKFDSPGENDQVRSLLIQQGLAAMSIPDDVWIADGSQIQYMRAWYIGYTQLIKKIAADLPAGVVQMNNARDISLMFDKPACQQWLQQHQIPVPRILPVVNSFDALLQVMDEKKYHRVFVKPAHASSASGVIAFRKSGERMQAVAATELRDGRLHNSLKVHTYTSPADIAILINTIIKDGVQVEEWLPKATLEERYFDIRVLVIKGRARHTVLRTSKHVITNLHLGNQRGNMQTFVATYGAGKLAEVKLLAERTAACFPETLYMGIDILLKAGSYIPYVLEVNAFGDLLPNLLDEGENCYEAELSAITV